MKLIGYSLVVVLVPAMVVVLVISAMIGLGVAYRPSLCWWPGEGDLHERAMCETYDKLGRYDEQPEEVVRWILSDRDAGIFSEVSYTLAEWALRNPDSFTDLLDRVPEEEVPYIWAIGHWGVTESGRTQAFVAEFEPRAESSERLRHLVDSVTPLR